MATFAKTDSRWLVVCLLAVGAQSVADSAATQGDTETSYALGIGVGKNGSQFYFGVGEAF